MRTSGSDHHEPRDLAPGVLLLAGGVCILGATLIGQFGAMAVIASLLLTTAGLAVLLVGMSLRRRRLNRFAWTSSLVGAALWLLGWLSPLGLAYLLPVPLWTWGVLSAAGFLVAATAHAVGGRWADASVDALFFAGSAASIAMLVVTLPFAPDSAFAPLGGAAIVASLVSFGSHAAKLKR